MFNGFSLRIFVILVDRLLTQLIDRWIETQRLPKLQREKKERERERNKPIPECLGRCGLSWILSEFTWACHLHTGSFDTIQADVTLYF